MAITFYYANLIVPEKISSFGDPEHSQWHFRSLSILFDMIPDSPCYIDSLRGPDYFAKYDIPILHDESSPGNLLIQQIKTPVSPFGKDRNICRYSLETREKKQQACDWLIYLDKPVVIWFCHSWELPQLPSVLSDTLKPKTSYTLPANPFFCVVYSWDSPVMEIVSAQTLDISLLLQHGWKRKKILLGKHLPLFSKIYKLDVKHNGICL